MQALQTIYRYWTAIVFLGILVQIGAAGYGAFYAADKSDPGPLTEHQFTHGSTSIMVSATPSSSEPSCSSCSRSAHGSGGGA